MAIRSPFLAETAILIVLLSTLGSTDALRSFAGSPKAISDLRDATVKALGLQANDLKISGFDLSDALVGHSVAYEFDIEIDKKVLPFKLLEDVNRWEYVDLPIFRTEEGSTVSGDRSSLVESRRKSDDPVSPVLAPFQLSGPMEIWIQDAKDMRLSLPHDVDAGVLKKVVLADGAVVSVKGARSVSLRHPLDLPLPLNQSQGNFASGLLTLADHLRHTSRTQEAQPLSLRIVGPTSLTSSPFSSDSKLKLKRLAPGLVELSSPSRTKGIEAISTVDGGEAGEPTTLLTPDRFTTMWPLASINGSNPNLQGFEALLLSVLGEKANEKGSFRLLKAEVSAQTFVKFGFGVEKGLKEGGEEVNWEAFPEWRTRPESVKMHFEVLAKVDGEKVVPERVVPVKPVEFEDSIATHVLGGNVTMSRVPVAHLPPDPFTL
ncbi:uncharacterized protein LOC122662632 [Telopea speciosissima]|uniref:uncharacterized protein LOC122662632 n=1 Tax=Telopea speciosissima TaxID=54955 RepID=UPI001CC67F99|nr:uncharacterized protein LOC122662632 [Telopea speciosissima]